MSYLWLKAFHLIAVMAWMAGLLYLPRLLVYHRGTPVGSPSSETFKLMERRLFGAIMLPAMIASWLLGVGLAWETRALIEWQLWFMIKAVGVVGLTLYQFWLAGFVRRFAHDQRPRTVGFFRAINEIPTALMIIIVIVAVVKPI
jgi:protoporphyrinogen IX oxidase